MTRRTLLNDERIEQVRKVANLGLSEREAAAVIGIDERTWHNWKSRGRKICERLGDKKTSAFLKMPELREMAVELGVILDRIHGTGVKSRILKRDIVEAVDKRGKYYRQFFQQLDSSKAHLKAALLGQLDRVVKGGKVIVEVDDNGNVIRRGVRKRTVITDRKLVTTPGKGGGPDIETWVTTGIREIVEEAEMQPQPQAIFKMLEAKFPEEFARVKPRDLVGVVSARDKATDISSAVRLMLDTVPDPEGVAVNGKDVDLEALVGDITKMSDDEVKAALAKMA